MKPCGCCCEDDNLGPVEKKVVELMRLHVPPYEILRVLGAAIDNIETGTGGGLPEGWEYDGNNDTLTINGVVYKLQRRDKSIVRTELSDINVSLEYEVIDGAGGTAVPVFNYYQTRTNYYSDGSVETETYNEGAEVKFSTNIDGAVVGQSDGTLIMKPSSAVTQTNVGSVTVTVKLNGIVKVISSPIYQKANQALMKNNVIYVGAMDVSRDGFADVSADALKTNADQIKYAQAYTGSYQASKPAFFMMIPVEGCTMNKVSYGSDPLITDILGKNLWNIRHENVMIDGKEYKVFGYYAGMVDSNTRLTYDYKVSATINAM